MISRCYRQDRPDYARYGGRGVTVCDEWRGSFEAFLADMGFRPEGLQIDRIDTTKGYSRDNCRWVTSKQNNRNRRCTAIVNFEGQQVSVPDLAERFNVELTALYNRLASGWDLQRALTTPGTRGYFVRPSGARRTCQA